MRGLIIRNIFLLCGMLLLVACQVDDLGNLHTPSGTASLSVVIKGPEHTQLSVRGVEDLNDNGTVTAEERILDGQQMYQLMVCIVESGRVISSYTLTEDDSRFRNGNTEAVVTFVNLDYSKTYELYAVANYGNYGALTGALADFFSSTVLSPPALNASSDNICDVTSVYPLSLKQQVRLNPGENTVNGELKRTYARLRINVRNQSAENDLTVTSLTFPTRFTSKSVNLFTEGGNAEVSPVTTSAGAVTPFVPNMQIRKITDEGSVSEATIFDTYLLESDDGTYNYSLGLKYQREDVEESFVVSNTPITNVSGIKDGGMYVMYNTAGAYLYANGNSVGAGTSYRTNNNELNHNYVWKFTKTTGNNYIIESMGSTGYYMQSSKVSNSSVPLTTNKGNNDYFTVSTSNTGNRIYFQSTASTGDWWSYYFLSLSQNGKTVCGNTSSRRDFYLYEITKNNSAISVSKEISIPISIIDKITGETSPLTSIRRNDFVEMLVNVSYNQKTGEIDYEVWDWDRVNGEVTFD